MGFGSHRDGNTDVPCDIMRGLSQFINGGVGNIVQAPFIGVQLEDYDCTGDGASSSSGSSDSHESDESDGGKFSKTCVEEIQKAVKVNQVNLGSFAHGFGLR